VPNLSLSTRERKLQHAVQSTQWKKPPTIEIVSGFRWTVRIGLWTNCVLLPERRSTKQWDDWTV